MSRRVGLGLHAGTTSRKPRPMRPLCGAWMTNPFLGDHPWSPSTTPRTFRSMPTPAGHLRQPRHPAGIRIPQRRPHPVHGRRPQHPMRSPAKPGWRFPNGSSAPSPSTAKRATIDDFFAAREAHFWVPNSERPTARQKARAAAKAIQVRHDRHLARIASGTGLIKWEIPRLCRGGSRSLTFPWVVPGFDR
jgi:hypothetical protein